MDDNRKEETGSFEEAMMRLEEIVGQMESGELPLEEILVRYEEGTRLVRHCSGKLAAAEKRIEIIARNAAGEPEVTPFESSQATPVVQESAEEPVRKTRSARASRSSASSEESASEDVSLF